MINIVDKSQCTGCTACESICGKDAISMQFDEFGHLYPKIDESKCVDCGLCDKVCPMLHTGELPKDEKLEELPVYAAYCKNEEDRMKSTSGGLFTVLSNYIIENGGVVYAARFNGQFHIFHDSFDNIGDIDPFRGSKYAQSDLGGIFRRIKRDLKTRKVLFVGTPCQVAGLKSFLVKEFENLYTCDFVCMSISSPKMWDEYVTAYQNKHRIKRIFFKDKRNGWHKTDWRMLIEDEQGEHLCKGFDNPYFYAYLYHYSARPSCFSCSFRQNRHISDFTIADCWGIETVNPFFDDNKGCTTLILQSEKSKTVFNQVKDRMNYIDFGIENVRHYNRHIDQQAVKPSRYELFNEKYKLHGFDSASRMVMRGNCSAKIMDKIKYYIKRFF